MQQPTSRSVFSERDFSVVKDYDYEPFHKGRIDVQLPAPNSEMRLFIFNPFDYPYLWSKYLEGLQREYGRMGVGHILDLDMLNKPDSVAMCVLGVINEEIISGIRFHGPLRSVEEASVCKEMGEGNVDLLKEYVASWIPEKVVEPKGLWLDVKHASRECIVQSMSRSIIYGAALLGARYAAYTSPERMTNIYINIGLDKKDEIGCVAYPNDKFKTAFGVQDLHTVLDNCTDQNRILLKRDWQQIQRARLNCETQKNDADTWLPIVLDEANPFHAEALDDLLFNSDYEKRTNFESMQTELSELVPPISEDLQSESKRWIAYPWRKVTTELVGPKSFKRLLRDRNRNKITDSEQDKLSTLTVGVVGLSTGHVIAHTMVMEGVCGHIKLADFDTLEVSNLNRIPASLLDIGANKAVITARRIAELDPYMTVEIFDKGLQKSNIDSFMRGVDVVIEECDSLDVKVLVREAAIKRKIPVLMSTSDLGMMDVERFDLDVDPKPFHGLTEVKAAELKDLSRRDKSGYALAIMEGEKISARLAASMVEIDYTVSTWAQLASDVTQGAAIVTTAVRRIGTGQLTPSSRTRMNMDSILENGTLPTPVIIDETMQDDPIFTERLKEDMLLAASFAPSPGNIQPWKLRWVKDKFNLEIDKTLTVSMDVKWRGAMVALGAASLNAEIVAAHHKEKFKITHFPTKSKPDLISQFTLGTGDDHVNRNLECFYPYLLSRKTNRLLSERKTLSAGIMAKLSAVSKQYPVKLHMLSKPSQLESYADISIESDRLRHLSQHLHSEMMQELVWPEKDNLEQGIDVRTLGLETKDLNVLPILERPDVMKQLADLEGGKALGDYNKDRILSSSAMVVLTATGDSDLDYVIGGKAMQHFWLIAEQNGLSVQPISPIFLYANNDEDIQNLMQQEYQSEVVDLRQRFSKLLNIAENEYPILVLKLSYADESKFRSLRRKG